MQQQHYNAPGTIQRSSCYARFYRGECTTILDNMSYDDVLNALDDTLEKRHGYIQWIFPSRERSRLQPNAVDELLTDAALWELQNDADIRHKISKIISRMLHFWGIGFDVEGNSMEFFILNEEVFDKKLGKPDHNQLRLTRMLKFIKELGWNDFLDPFKAFILTAMGDRCKTAVRHWKAV